MVVRPAKGSILPPKAKGVLRPTNGLAHSRLPASLVSFWATIIIDRTLDYIVFSIGARKTSFSYPSIILAFRSIPRLVLYETSLDASIDFTNPPLASSLGSSTELKVYYFPHVSFILFSTLSIYLCIYLSIYLYIYIWAHPYLGSPTFFVMPSDSVIATRLGYNQPTRL